MSIVIRECDDWVAVYKDGKKVWENHSCPLTEGLEALGIEFEQVDLFDRVNDLGQMDDGSDPFPDELPGTYPKVFVPGFGDIDRVGHMDAYKDGEFDRKAFNSCARCETDEHTQFFNCDAMWGDGDLVCTNCNGYVRMRDSG